MIGLKSELEIQSMQSGKMNTHIYMYIVFNYDIHVYLCLSDLYYTHNKRSLVYRSDNTSHIVSASPHVRNLYLNAINRR